MILFAKMSSVLLVVQKIAELLAGLESDGIAGRNPDKANKLIAKLDDSRHVALILDQDSDQFTKELDNLNIDCLMIFVCIDQNPEMFLYLIYRYHS